jgi:DNA-binding GntR family transcriptional regulator
VSTSPVLPKYYQVEQLMRRRIMPLSSGAALPSEPDLAKEYGVSRSTVRSAIETLAAEGLLQRVQGRGTFVCGEKLEYPIGYHQRTPQPQADELPDHEIVGFRSARDEDRAKTFGIGPSEKVLEVTRVTSVNGVPMGMGQLWLPRRSVPNAKRSDFQHGRFFYTLADLGVLIHRFRVTIESVVIDANAGELIGIRPGLPGLGLKRAGFSKAGDLVAMVEIMTRGDLARYVMEFDANLFDEGIET